MGTLPEPLPPAPFTLRRSVFCAGLWHAFKTIKAPGNTGKEKNLRISFFILLRCNPLKWFPGNRSSAGRSATGDPDHC
jgi:hypothetical protein